MNTVSRGSFLKAAGVATGAAAVAATPVAAALQPSAVEAAPSAPISHEPIIAIIRDAQKGEVTVLSGKTEKTYVDKLLVKRLLKAAALNHVALQVGVK